MPLLAKLTRNGTLRVRGVPKWFAGTQLKGDPSSVMLLVKSMVESWKCVRDVGLSWRAADSTQLTFLIWRNRRTTRMPDPVIPIMAVARSVVAAFVHRFADRTHSSHGHGLS